MRRDAPGPVPRRRRPPAVGHVQFRHMAGGCAAAGKACQHAYGGNAVSNKNIITVDERQRVFTWRPLGQKWTLAPNRHDKISDPPWVARLVASVL